MIKILHFLRQNGTHFSFVATKEKSFTQRNITPYNTKLATYGLKSQAHDSCLDVFILQIVFKQLSLICFLNILQKNLLIFKINIYE